LEIKNIEFINKRRIEMKYIVAINNEITGTEIIFLENEKYLKQFLNDWELIQTVDWNNLEKYDSTLAEYIAYKEDKLGRRTEAYLRVVKG
jgi:hypothetical protein